MRTKRLRYKQDFQTVNNLAKAMNNQQKNQRQKFDIASQKKQRQNLDIALQEFWIILCLSQGMEHAGMWQDGTQVQYPFCRQRHIGWKSLEEIQYAGIRTSGPSVWISSYNNLSRVKYNQDKMTAYLSKMWHMKKVNEIAIKKTLKD